MDARNPEKWKQEEIDKLDSTVTDLNVIDNFNVKDVSHLKDLKTLRIAGYCGVDQEGIGGLNKVTELDISYNSKITDVSFMPLLKLKIQGPVDAKLPPSLTELDVSHNPIKLPDLPNLTVLAARGNTSITPLNAPPVEMLIVTDNPNF